MIAKAFELQLALDEPLGDARPRLGDELGLRDVDPSRDAADGES